MKSCLSCRLCKKDIGYIPGNSCMVTGGFNLGGMENCKISVTDEDIEAARKEVEVKRMDKEPLTCSSCSFALNNDNGDPLPEAIRYCQNETREFHAPLRVASCILKEIKTQRAMLMNSTH